MNCSLDAIFHKRTKKENTIIKNVIIKIIIY